MKPISLFLFLALTMTALAFGQSTGLKANQNSKEEQALIKLEREWNEAYKNLDKEVLERVMADDFVFIDEGSNVNPKAPYIASTLKNVKVESYNLEEMKVRIYGDTGIVTAVWTGKLTVNGKDVSGSFRYTDVFVKRRGRWVCITSQETRIPKKDS